MINVREARTKKLLVLDNLDGLYHEKCGISYDVLLFGIETDSAKSFLIKKNPSCDCYHFLNDLRAYEHAEQQVRAFYLSQFPIISSEVQRSFNRDPNLHHLWVFLRWHERSPFKGQLANQLFLLAELDYFSKRKIYATIEYNFAQHHDLLGFFNGDQRHSRKTILIKFTIQLLRFFLDFLLVKILIAHVGGQTKRGSTSKLFFFTLVPHWWSRTSPQKFDERFFPCSIVSGSTGDSRYLIWTQDLVTNWKTTLHILHDLEFEFQILNSQLRIRDFFTIVGNVRKSGLFQAVHSFSSGRDWFFCNFNIAPILLNELCESITAGEFIQAQLVNVAVTRHGSDNPNSATIYRYENQSIDHALTLGLKRSLTGISIGYWHTALAKCSNYFPFWNIDSTFLCDKDEASTPGLWPDRMIYPNSLTLETLVREAFPRDKSIYVPPTRHDGLISQLVTFNANLDRDLRSVRRVTISCSADSATSLLMLQSVFFGISGLNNLRIGFRPHPAWNLDESELTKLDLWPEFKNRLELIPDSGSMYEWIAASDFLVASGSQLVLEALCLGTVPIVFQPISLLNPTNMDAFSEFCLIAHDVDSLQAQIDKAIRTSREAQMRLDLSNDLISIFLGNYKAWKHFQRKNLFLESLIQAIGV